MVTSQPLPNAVGLFPLVIRLKAGTGTKFCLAGQVWRNTEHCDNTQWGYLGWYVLKSEKRKKKKTEWLTKKD